MRASLHVTYRWVRLLIACLVAIAVTGCAAEQSPRVKVINAYAGTYVYHHPSERVVEGVRALLEERGFSVMPVQRGEAVQTEWKQLLGSEQVAEVDERYFVVVHRLTREHSRVMAVKLQISTVGMETYHPRRPFNKDGQEGHTVNSAPPSGTGLAPLPMGKPLVTRAIDLEWALIHKLDPTRARQIEATADDVARRVAAH